jgi:hypothetical protein
LEFYNLVLAMLSVLIPSRLARNSAGRLFLEAAIDSVRAQTARDQVRVEILVGIDAGAEIPPSLVDATDVRFAESGAHSQAAALNAAARLIGGDTVAILEDDDLWHPTRLAIGLQALGTSDFVSSNQLETDAERRFARINDYPTPSGWLMHRQVWDSVGPFNEEFRLHLDNEWLGRLGMTGARRIHLVEATAPDRPSPERPGLGSLARYARPQPQLMRHTLPSPLILRLIHPGSGLHAIQTDTTAKARSEHEYELLMAQFGRLPW